MSDVTPPQAGWYADPEDPAGERWWNGSGWSDHKRAATVGADAASGDEVPQIPAAGAADTGFTFGAPAGSAASPDPYASAAPYAPAAPYASTPYAPAPYGAPQRSNTNGLAIAGLAVSAAGWIIAGVLAAIAGIILSGFGLARARQMEAAGHPNSGRGIAMAGLVIGIVVLVLGVLLFVVYFVFLLTMGYPA